MKQNKYFLQMKLSLKIHAQISFSFLSAGLFEATLTNNDQRIRK